MFALELPPPPPPPPQRVLVYAREHHFSPSRQVVRPGVVQLQVKNNGEDDHHMGVFDRRGRQRSSTGIIRPGQVVTIRVRLRRGRYALICGVGDHFEQGMHTGLRVRPKPRPARGGRR